MEDRDKNLPFLGRMMTWVDRPGSANKIFWALALVSLGLFLADFTYKKYGAFAIETIPGFFGFSGFVMFTAVVLLSKALRVLVKRPEDYYGNKTIDCEDYPADQLDKVDFDA